ncbi:MULTISPECIES: chorismate-binding protein [unclassified Streptomyces]|uniref:chorismate-binding protein n=1 Tax=unclassified Streptomyces TaxID=2593676 RepID=UPI000DAC9E1D|nr:MULTISPECIES: chorismate-binding protein [unclassified Streptomyces]PZT72594.1 hypothetical protein DNK55_29235 [Streptomyces sp. AC1-42T]PZT81088.1 hypothetical protein DNK56_02335 [Streptomyces sp. AC1-42W]
MTSGADEPPTCGPGPLLRRILAGDPPPFALLHRPRTAGADRLELMTGTVSEPGSIAELPLPQGPGADRHDVLAVLPYRQLAERGFTCPDDGAPLLALTVEDQCGISRQEFLRDVPDLPIRMDELGFDIDDEAYARTVRRIVKDEIGCGVGANFVFKRTYRVDLADWSAGTALAVFRRLLQRESGAYWTFLIHTGDRCLVGATPEGHVSLGGGDVTMNPISGTYRYPAAGADPEGVSRFQPDGWLGRQPRRRA